MATVLTLVDAFVVNAVGANADAEARRDAINAKFICVGVKLFGFRVNELNLSILL